METVPEQGILHASAVAVDGQGLLITGATGAGKSALAVALLGLGAKLVSDDLTHLSVAGGVVTLRCPEPTLMGVVEARGIGLLRCEAIASAALALVVDLDRHETDRLPPHRYVNVLGASFPLVYGSDSPIFPVALMLQLRHGRHA